jgi:hypothetical protein
MKGNKMLNVIRNLTPTQWIILFISTSGFLNASAAQLTEWFGPHVAHNIITGIGFAQGLIGTWAMALNTQGARIQNVVSDPTAQGALVKAVLAMPGVENMTISAKATPQLAQVAVDPSEDKIAPTPEATAAVTATAKAAA